jgi:hypothetical protein
MKARTSRRIGLAGFGVAASIALIGLTLGFAWPLAGFDWADLDDAPSDNPPCLSSAAWIFGVAETRGHAIDREPATPAPAAPAAAPADLRAPPAR